MKFFHKTDIKIVCVSLLCLAAVWFNIPSASYNKYEVARKQTVLLQSEHGQGTGVVAIRKNLDGQRRVFVWTAAHVVSEVSELKAWQGTKKFSAIVLLRNPELDLALLWLPYIDPTLFINAEFENDSTLGDEVYHVGNFLGDNFPGSVSTGVLSNIGVHPIRFSSWPWPVADSTDCTILPGSSGGPLFCKRHNHVIGLTVGHVGAAGLNIFVPERAMESWAKSRHIEWALHGNYCFSDNVLQTFIDLDASLNHKQETL